jgi:hypothetical protein
MPPIIRLWLTTNLFLGSLMVISEWLTGAGIFGASSRFALAVSACACLLTVMRRWWHKTVDARLEPLLRTLAASEMGKDSGGPPAPGSDEIAKLAFLVHRVCSRLDVSREAASDSGHEVVAASLCRGLSRNLGLAADHVESIKALLDVSQAHQQPIPRAAFQNLELVSKHLRTIERQLDAGPQDARLEGAFQFR